MIPFCRVIRPTKSTNGFVWIDAETLERGRGRDLAIFVEIDAVVDDVQPLGFDLEQVARDRFSSPRETAMTASAISSAVFSSQTVKS